jgi:hypothetical protein
MSQAGPQRERKINPVSVFTVEKSNPGAAPTVFQNTISYSMVVHFCRPPI